MPAVAALPFFARDERILTVEDGDGGEKDVRAMIGGRKKRVFHDLALNQPVSESESGEKDPG